MMEFTNEDIEEFRSIYEKEFGETISEAEAREMASRVMALYELLAKPLPSEKDRPRS